MPSTIERISFLETMDITALDRYLSPAFRSEFERRYWEPINHRAKLEQAIGDQEFLNDPMTYAPFFSDHGVVHARDVAAQILRVLEASHGVLIPRRDAARLEFMAGYGVLLAYVHDIGMVDFSRFGRAMHPEYATQKVFGPEFDDLAQRLWDENAGGLAAHLAGAAAAGARIEPGPLLLREMLALASCHSKSKVPIGLFADPARIRAVVQEQACTDLDLLYQRQQAARARRAAIAAREDGVLGGEEGALTQAAVRAVTSFAQAARQAEAALGTAERAAAGGGSQAQLLGRLYADFARDAYLWLVAGGEATRELIADIFDTLRALRCADALRQRGSALKTSGGYEIFIDRRTANAVYALRLGQDRLYLLEVAEEVASGEANVSASELTCGGDLRIAFHRGVFADPDTVWRAATNAAIVVNDIQADAIESFRRPAGSTSLAGLKSADEMAILIEGVDDNPDFAEMVRRALEGINPEAAGRARSVPSLQSMAEIELTRYLAAGELDWDLDVRRQMLDRIAASGHKVAGIHPIHAFGDVRLIALSPGDALVEAGAPAGFVYIPLGPGLKVIPLGGYASFSVQPWMPLGVTAVIRGATRNATILAEEHVSLLAIPKEIYLREWHRTYGAGELRSLLCERCE